VKTLAELTVDEESRLGAAVKSHLTTVLQIHGIAHKDIAFALVLYDTAGDAEIIGSGGEEAIANVLECSAAIMKGRVKRGN